MDEANGHGGSNQRGKYSRKREPTSQDGHDVTLSRALSYLLRHGAPKEKKLTIHPGGYIDVDEILRLPKFSRFSLENIKSVVEDNDKQRFTLRTDEASGKLQICANQGHSFPIEDTELEPIHNPADYPTVIHGTFMKKWESIKTSGLKRMNRNHIHFAPGEPGEEGVISGMRSSADVHIYVDIEKALNDGIKFFRSKNNVILSPGNDDGILEMKYFAKVVNVRDGNAILKIESGLRSSLQSS